MNYRNFRMNEYQIKGIYEILTERERQEDLKREGKFKKSCSDDMTDQERLVVLAEEFGEVAKEVCESRHPKHRTANMRTELIQVAAVCLAWVEGIDSEKDIPF